MAIGKRRDSRGGVPTCALTCRDSGLGGSYPPSAQNLPLCGPTSRTSRWTVEPSLARRSRGMVRISDDVRWSIADEKNV
jgi:hypothetical protein